MPNFHDVAAQDQLSPRQLAIYHGELSRAQKTPLVAYVLWFFTGGVAGHQLYLGNLKKGLMMAGLNIGGWTVMLIAAASAAASGADSDSFGIHQIFLIAGFGMVAAAGCFLLIDLFTIPSQIRTRDATLRADLIVQLTANEETN